MPRRKNPVIQHSSPPSTPDIRLVQVRDRTLGGPVLRYELERRVAYPDNLYRWVPIELIVRAES